MRGVTGRGRDDSRSVSIINIIMSRSTSGSMGLVTLALFGILLVGCNARSVNFRMANGICDSAVCHETATNIMQHMNPKADPCNNFYEFACGNFTQNAVIREDRSTAELFSELRDKVQAQLYETINEEIKTSDPRSFQLVKQFFDVCMNEEQIDETSEKQLLEILKKLGGWPVIDGDAYDEEKFDWVEAMYAFRENGFSFNSFIGFSIGPDMKNNRKNLIYIDQAGLGLSQQYMSKGLEHKVVKAYYKYMVEFAVILGTDRETAEKELGESLNFAIELAKISLGPKERRDTNKLYNPMTVSDLESKYPYLSWQSYFTRLMAPHVKVQATDIVINAVPSYFEKLGDLIAKTPKRVLANYAFWRVASETAGKMSERIQKARREFAGTMTGNTAKGIRWQTCVSLVNSNLDLATSALYIRKHFDSETKESALEMILSLRQTLSEMISKVSWMDDKTRTEAIEKLNKVHPFVGYPDEFYDDSKLNNFYENLKIYPDSFLKTSLSIGLLGLNHQFAKFPLPVNKTDWTANGFSAVVNAFYSPNENSIKFPAAILQGTFFNKDNPRYMNYAGIGSVMGHEFTHGFDDMGRQFDKDGNLVDWWDPKTKEKYLKRAQCIIDQYSGYLVKEVEMNVDGFITQGENIADNGGTKEAYLAYEAYEAKNGPEPRLPGLENYSPRQMFWIANANVWCAKYRPEYLSNLIQTDPHTPNEFRVVGPLSNRPEFAKDFNCPVGSPMNPEKKCSVW